MKQSTKNKVMNIVHRPFHTLPVGVDLPKFIGMITIQSVAESNLKKIVYSPNHCAADVSDTIDNLSSFFEVLAQKVDPEIADTISEQFTKHMHDVSSVNELARPLLEFMKDLKGDESPIVRFVKVFNQAVISPVFMEFKMALGMGNITKHVPHAWRICVTFNETEGEECIIIVISNMEQNINGYFQFKWDLILKYTKNVRFKGINLVISDLRFNMRTISKFAKKRHTNEKLLINNVKKIFRGYVAKSQVLEHSTHKKWIRNGQLPEDAPEPEVTVLSKKITYDNGDTYEGDVVIKKDADNEKDEGTYVRTGSGVYTTTSGDVFVGDFVSNKRQGKGVFTSKDGTSYEGDFYGGQCHGRGVYVWPNGDVYTGQFVRGVFHGDGSWSSSKGDSYVGDFVSGKRHGFGESSTFKGGKYKGRWKDGKKHGQGLYHFANGDRYEGAFKSNLPHGKGTYTFVAGQTMKVTFDKGRLKAVVG